MRRAAIIVLDGVGIGSAPDAHLYGDTGSNTLGNVARAVGGLTLPHLEALGLGYCADLSGVARPLSPRAAHGSCVPASPGKDSTTGHWELCGLILESPFPTYPEGFPPALIADFARQTGRSVLGNKPASGTAVLDEYGEEHCRTGQWIVYTSADSVFQIAAHESIVSLDELYRACSIARELLRGEHGVSRVIARPFTGGPGAWKRTARRRDFSLPPPGPTQLDHLSTQQIPRVGVGKVDD
jgi:phosphopentomutase